jgi:hypothetical protein
MLTDPARTPSHERATGQPTGKQATKTYRFVVEDFCYNRRKVEVEATSREGASEKLQEKVSAPITCAWVPALGEGHP